MIFIDNKYTRWYYSITERAQTRTVNGYTEKHHIIPRSLGGSDSADNFAVLTAREHFICHWLLTKMVSGKKQRYQMWNAVSSMIDRNNPYQTRYAGMSRKFQLLREEIAKQRSIKFSGKDNPMYGRKWSQEQIDAHIKRMTGRVVSDETREKCRNSRKHTGPNYKLRGENNANFKPGVAEKRKKTFLEKYGVETAGKMLWTCPHCGKSGRGSGNYARYHGGNCSVLKPRKTYICSICRLTLTNPSNYKRYHESNCKHKTNK